MKEHEFNNNGFEDDEKSEMILPYIKEKDGNLYNYVKLDLNGKFNEYKMDELMWQSWKGIIPEGHEIIHKDGNTLNDHIDNLNCVQIQ